MSGKTDHPVQTNPAELYQNFFVPAMFAPWAERLLERVPPRAGERVLDVASGTGVVSRRVAEIVGGDGSVVGLDISPGMLAVARSVPAPGAASIEWVEGSAVSLPFGDHEFDLVLCQQGLQFFPDRQSALNEMHRVLKPGGRLGLSVWRSVEHQTLFQAFDEATERHFGAMPEDVGPFSFGDAAKIRALADKAGFREIAVGSVTGPVRFPQPELFAELTIGTAAAVMPEYGRLSDDEREGLIRAIRRDLEAPIRQHTEDGKLVFTLTSHIVTARA
jgi:ubiquinone/menaquinone biosynthesis C-methylase UbiE